MRTEVQAVQRKPRLEVFRIVPASAPTGSAAESESGCPEGFTRCTLLKNATGDFTVNLNEPFNRIPIVSGLAVSSASSLKVIVHASTSASVVRVLVRNDSGTLTDPTELHLTVVGFDAADQVR